MGFFDKLKKSVEIKQARIDSKKNQKVLAKIPKLEKIKIATKSFFILKICFGKYI